jgi:hypothetical protein
MGIYQNKCIGFKISPNILQNVLIHTFIQEAFWYREIIQIR